MSVPQADSPKRLTPAERRLWQALTAEPGRIFSRAELAAQVMPDAIVEERTIDVHIHHLRKKLGAAGSRIEAVRKKGYRWVQG